MKPHERRQAGAYPYFKLATWDARVACWRDGRRTHPSIDAAIEAASTPGRYRISVISRDGRTDLQPFTKERDHAST